MRNYWAVIVFAFASFSPLVYAAEQIVADDAVYFGKLDSTGVGQTLFHFYQNDYFNSLVTLRVSEDIDDLGSHETNARLLRGSMYLSYGMPIAAEDIFTDLLVDNEVPASVKDRARYFLAKISYQAKRYQLALQYLDNIQTPLSDNLVQQDKLMKGLVLNRLGNNGDALQVFKDSLEEETNPLLMHYFRYNVGTTSLLLKDEKMGVDTLDELSRLKTQDPELKLLKDKANLAVGLYFFSENKTRLSRNYLERIRLDSPFANTALLALGWVHIDNESFKEALIPWYELIDRDLFDPTAQEAWLGVPFALSEAGFQGPAAEAFEKAIVLLESESERLTATLADVSTADIGAELVSDEDTEQLGWISNIEPKDNSFESLYLHELFASHFFQDEIKQYRDLLYLKKNLERAPSTLDSLNEMLNLRRQRFSVLQPKTVEGLNPALLNDAQSRRQAIENDRLANSEEWLTEKEKSLLSRIAILREALEGAADVDNIQLDKLNNIEGVLLWNISAAQPERLIAMDEGLQTIDEMISSIVSTQEKLQTLSTTDDSSFFAEQIARLSTVKQEYERVNPIVDRLLEKQNDYLRSLMVNVLQEKQERLAIYLSQARFGVAQIYDRGNNAGNDSSNEESNAGDKQ